MSWLSRAIDYVDDFLGGEKSQLEDRWGAGYPESVFYTDYQGNVYYQRLSDNKVRDPLTGIWMDKDTFANLIDPGLFLRDSESLPTEITDTELYNEKVNKFTEILKQSDSYEKAIDTYFSIYGEPGNVKKKSESQNNYTLLLIGGMIAFVVIK